MKIFGVDTSGPVSYLVGADFEGDRVFFEKNYKSEKMNHSENFLSQVDDCLKFASMELSQFDIFVCGIGPGSFTGIRTSYLTLKAIADYYEKPLMGFDSMNALRLCFDDQCDGVIRNATATEFYISSSTNNGLAEIIKKEDFLEKVSENKLPRCWGVEKHIELSIIDQIELSPLKNVALAGVKSGFKSHDSLNYIREPDAVMRLKGLL